MFSEWLIKKLGGYTRHELDQARIDGPIYETNIEKITSPLYPALPRIKSVGGEWQGWTEEINRIAKGPHSPHYKYKKTKMTKEEAIAHTGLIGTATAEQLYKQKTKRASKTKAKKKA